jgi:effector-binding domain-containing protein
MKTFLVFFVVISSSFAVEESECWKQLLSESGKLDKDCEIIVESHRKKYAENFLAGVENEYKRDFFEQSMKEFKIPEIYTKILAYHSTKGTNESEINEIVEKFTDSVNGVFSILQMSDDEVFSVFNRVYSKFPEKTAITNIDTETACKLNFFIEQSIIDGNDYGFDLSQNDLSDCNEIYKSIEEKTSEPRFTAAIHIPGTPSEKVNECIKKKNVEGRWMLMDESYEILSKIDLTDEQLDKFMKNYSSWFKNKFRGILSCLRDLF